MIKMPNQPVPSPPPPPSVSSFSSGHVSPPPKPCPAALPIFDQQGDEDGTPLSVQETNPADEYTLSTEPEEVNPSKLEEFVMQVHQSEEEGTKHDEQNENHDLCRGGEVDDNSSEQTDI